MLEYLVNKQYSSTTLLEFAGKVSNATSLEVEIIQVDVEARTICTKPFFGILQEECGFSYTTRTLDAYQDVLLIGETIFLIIAISLIRWDLVSNQWCAVEQSS